VAEVTWTVTAERDLDALAAYIADDSPSLASTFVQRLLDAADRLRSFPMLGRVVPEFETPELREILHGNYRLIYALRNNEAFILRVVHGSRDLGSMAGIELP